MKNKLLLLGYFLLLSSCVTLFNGPNSPLDIRTSEPSVIVINEDTFYTENNRVVLTLERKKEIVEVTAFTDSITKVIELDPKLSLAFYMNVFWPHAFLIERDRRKSYVYPKSIWLNMSDTLPHFYHYNIPDKGDLHFNLSIPYVNNFLFQPLNDRDFRTGTGLMGIGLGVEYYYQKNRFWSLSAYANADGIMPGRNEEFNTIAFSFSNNHRYKRYTYGYGLAYVMNSWSIDRFFVAGPPNSFWTPLLKESVTLGAQFSIYRQLKNNFYIGLVYRPTVLQVAPDVRLRYEHVISVDLAWKLKIN